VEEPVAGRAVAAEYAEVVINRAVVEVYGRPAQLDGMLPP
jgi:hypothetical protein